MTPSHEAPRAPDSAIVSIGSSELRVDTLPSKGFDIYSIWDVRTGMDLLFKTPWGWRDPAWSPPMGSRSADWLSRYPGGWQILSPNAGDDSISDPGVEGFHGEAAITAWTVSDRSLTSVTAEVHLMTAPLTLRRTISVETDQIVVSESVINRSPDSVAFHWVHHPAFGAPFLGEGGRIALNAKSIVPEPGRSGMDTVDALQAWPNLSTPTADLDLSLLPGQSSRREVFATLAEFETGEYRIVNDELNVGIALAWDLEIFPYTWFWQEIHASEGFPWFRQAYVIAIEPSSLIPGTGRVGGLQRGRRLRIEPHREATTVLVATVFDPRDPLVEITLESARNEASTRTRASALSEEYAPTASPAL